jgi:hypothetical protein
MFGYTQKLRNSKWHEPGNVRGSGSSKELVMIGSVTSTCTFYLDNYYGAEGQKCGGMESLALEKLNRVG